MANSEGPIEVETRRHQMFPALGEADIASMDRGAAAAGGELAVLPRDGRQPRSRTVVIASGARYRRPAKYLSICRR